MAVVAQSEVPGWVGAVTAGAVRLAAEAGADVDEILQHAGHASPATQAAQVARLEQSAETTEVAADLAGLLWADCEDVPPIATILEEPATQAALASVAEARHQAAARLAWAAGSPLRPRAKGPGSPLSGQPEVPNGAAAPDRSRPPAPAPVASPISAATTRAEVPAAGARRLSPGAAVAGAAAAIVLFGRRLRRT